MWTTEVKETVCRAKQGADRSSPTAKAMAAALMTEMTKVMVMPATVTNEDHCALLFDAERNNLLRARKGRCGSECVLLNLVLFDVKE